MEASFPYGYGSRDFLIRRETMTPKAQELKAFLESHLQQLVPEGGRGDTIHHPSFDLYARDYIAFAEKEIATKDDRSLINCVGHLKRAIDCQLDCFLHAYGLGKLFAKRNLKFDKKLEFLQAAGAFSARTLSRLNGVRNRMEHSYAIPDIEDLDAYLDLTVAFVGVLERTILFLNQVGLEFSIIEDEDGYEEVHGLRMAKHRFEIEYERQHPSVTARWRSPDGEKEIRAGTPDMVEFTYFFRIFILLSLRYAVPSDRFILSQL
jgi:hypothetical protein